VDKHTIPPAGDPFTSAPRDRDPSSEADEHVVCGCWDGFHWLGIAVEAASLDIADGEGVVYERVPCRRCQPEAR
jgi:hypothetical protein